MPGTAGTSWYPAMPSLSTAPLASLPRPASPPVRSGRITMEGQRGGKRGNRSNFGTPRHSSGKAAHPDRPTCAERAPVPWQGTALGSTWGAPPPAPRQVLMALCSLGASTQLHSSCLTLHYEEFSKCRKCSQVVPVRCSTAPWAMEERASSTALNLLSTCTRNRTHFTTLANCNFTGLVAFLFLICAGNQRSVLIITLKYSTACTQSKVLLQMEELHIFVSIQQVFKILFLQIKKAT